MVYAYSSLPDTLIVDGTDIQALTGVILDGPGALDGLLAPGTRRGDDAIVQMRNGSVGAELPLAAYDFDIPIKIVLDETQTDPIKRRASIIARWRAVTNALAGTNGLVMLTRRLSNVGGTYDEHFAHGRVLAGLGLQFLDLHTGQGLLSFRNLDGAWFDAAAPTVPIVP